MIQVNELSSKTQSSVFEKQLQEGEIKFFQKMSNNRFLIGGNKSQLGKYEYLSNVYRNEKNSIIIVLPRIALMLKPGYSISSITSDALTFQVIL